MASFKIFILVLILFGFRATHQELALRISKQGNVVFCDITQVTLHFTSRTIELETPQGNLNLTVIASKVGETAAWIAADERGNRYIVDDISSPDKKGKGYIFVPEIDYLYTYTIANQPLCE